MFSNEFIRRVVKVKRNDGESPPIISRQKVIDSVIARLRYIIFRSRYSDASIAQLHWK